MKHEEIIEVVIDEYGDATVDHVSGEGKGCIDATSFLEEGLGSVVVRKLKPSYHRKPKVEEKRKIGRGK